MFVSLLEFLCFDILVIHKKCGRLLLNGNNAAVAVCCYLRVAVVGFLYSNTLQYSTLKY